MKCQRLRCVCTERLCVGNCSFDCLLCFIRIWIFFCITCFIVSYSNILKTVAENSENSENLWKCHNFPRLQFFTISIVTKCAEWAFRKQRKLWQKIDTLLMEWIIKWERYCKPNSLKWLLLKNRRQTAWKTTSCNSTAFP